LRLLPAAGLVAILVPGGTLEGMLKRVDEGPCRAKMKERNRVEGEMACKI
jgi:hypothetical protein